MFCSYCGAQLADGSAFCSSCGSQLSQSVAAPAPAQVMQQPSYQEQKNAVRESEMAVMQSLYNHFSQAAEDYEAYDACCELVNYYSKGAKSSLLVWGCIIATFGIIACLAPEAILGALIGFLIPGAAMITGGILMKVANRKNYNEYLELYDQLSNSLAQHYDNYPNCPIGPEYSNPVILEGMMSILQSGRADTIKECINILIENARQSEIDAYLEEIERNTAQTQANTRAAAVFLAADFFLNRQFYLNL